jgi:hypothetical protein
MHGIFTGHPLATFQSTCRRYGWEPIKSESWHIQHPYGTLGYASLQEAIRDVGNWAK